MRVKLCTLSSDRGFDYKIFSQAPNYSVNKSTDLKVASRACVLLIIAAKRFILSVVLL